MELGLANGLTMPYHAYAPLAAVTPTRDPVRVRVCVSSVTFCVQLKIYAAARRAAGGGGAGAGASPDTGTPWLAFYFILFALITSPATLLKNIFACWEISRSLFHAASLQSPLLPPALPAPRCLLGRACARTWHGTQQEPSSSWQVHTFRSGC